MKGTRFQQLGLILALLVVFVGVLYAQSTGYRFSGTGMIFAGNGTVCFEPTYNAGPDACIQRSGAGHISLLTGSLTPNKDMMGSGASPLTVTFTNAYTVAPLCVASDASATPAAIQVVATTTTLTLTGTAAHTLNYVCFGNPN
jgi:hypothetical protein